MIRLRYVAAILFANLVMVSLAWGCPDNTNCAFYYQQQAVTNSSNTIKEQIKTMTETLRQQPQGNGQTAPGSSNVATPNRQLNVPKPQGQQRYNSSDAQTTNNAIQQAPQPGNANQNNNVNTIPAGTTSPIHYY